MWTAQLALPHLAMHAMLKARCHQCHRGTPRQRLRSCHCAITTRLQPGSPWPQGGRVLILNLPLLRPRPWPGGAINVQSWRLQGGCREQYSA